MAVTQHNFSGAFSSSSPIKQSDRPDSSNGYWGGFGSMLATTPANATIAYAKIWGCTTEVDFKGLMPPLINDHACYEIALATAQASADDEALVNPELGKSTGAEDFAWMIREVPGAFMRIGNGVEADGTFYGTHTPKFNFNDDIIGLGADYWVTLVHKAAERVLSNV